MNGIRTRVRAVNRASRGARGVKSGARDVSMRVDASDGVSHPARRVARRHVASRRALAV